MFPFLTFWSPVDPFPLSNCAANVPICQEGIYGNGEGDPIERVSKGGVAFIKKKNWEKNPESSFNENVGVVAIVIRFGR